MDTAPHLDFDSAVDVLTNIRDRDAERCETNALFDLRYEAREIIAKMCGDGETALAAARGILNAIDRSHADRDWSSVLGARAKLVRSRRCTIPGVSSSGMTFRAAAHEAVMRRPSILASDLRKRAAAPSGVFLALVAFNIAMEYGPVWRNYGKSDAMRRQNVLRTLGENTIWDLVGGLSGAALNASGFQWWSETGSSFHGELDLLASLLCP